MQEEYLWSSYWIAKDIDCFKENEVQYSCDTNLGTSNDTDNISDTTIKPVRTKNFNQIVITDLNIKFLRNNFEL